jgi:hypothetical protein
MRKLTQSFPNRALVLLRHKRLGDQESVGRDAQRGVVVEATPTSPFEMTEPDLEFGM